MKATSWATLLACILLWLALITGCGGDDSGGPAESPASQRNTPPQVGVTADLSRAAVLRLGGSVQDNTLPQGQVTTRWAKVDGPGPVEFADPSRLDTTATFTVPGVYTLRLTATDGEFTVSDDLEVRVHP